MLTILFYSSILFSLLFLAISLIRNSSMFIVLSVLFAIPYSFYFAGIPMMRWMILIPVLYLLLFYYFRRKINYSRSTNS
ncbi:hypothetical protein DFR56_101508 [Pseudogracilibacillus auburnensis]|uniref:Uncharacterized protein n=1 Tax=Pseudogracilibacillus auburnensis TaxID=1494959 RepID=A0A2V3WAP5_9BACI|nr:hypothetical protein DFR56_101508 [Pseudogracilibacillus auburnensis]